MFLEEIDINKIDNLNEEEEALLKAFSCGKKHIDDYLHSEALEDLSFGITKTFLFFGPIDGSKEILGYFTLTSDRVLVTRKSKTEKGLKDWSNPVKRESIPAIQIHHFAVNKKFQRRGIGSNLIYYVFQFIKSSILPNMGACLVTVQSEKDVKEFYKKIGFESTGQTRDSNCGMAFLTKDFYIEDVIKSSKP